MKEVTIDSFLYTSFNVIYYMLRELKIGSLKVQQYLLLLTQYIKESILIICTQFLHWVDLKLSQSSSEVKYRRRCGKCSLGPKCPISRLCHRSPGKNAYNDRTRNAGHVASGEVTTAISQNVSRVCTPNFMVMALLSKYVRFLRLWGHRLEDT